MAASQAGGSPGGEASDEPQASNQRVDSAGYMKDVDFNTECAEPEVVGVGRKRKKGGTAYTSLKVGDVELSLDNHIYVGTETAGDAAEIGRVVEIYKTQAGAVKVRVQWYWRREHFLELASEE